MFMDSRISLSMEILNWSRKVDIKSVITLPCKLVRYPFQHHRVKDQMHVPRPRNSPVSINLFQRPQQTSLEASNLNVNASSLKSVKYSDLGWVRTWQPLKQNDDNGWRESVQRLDPIHNLGMIVRTRLTWTSGYHNPFILTIVRISLA